MHKSTKILSIDQEKVQYWKRVKPNLGLVVKIYILGIIRGRGVKAENRQSMINHYPGVTDLIVAEHKAWRLDSMRPKPITTGHASALDRFLYGINESVFQIKLGVANIELVNYLNRLLMRFVRIDSMKDVVSGTGSPTTQICELLNEVEKSSGFHRRNLYQSIGDYTLFWSGMYPESLQRRRNNCFPAGMIPYAEYGKRCYEIASRMDPTNQQPSKQVLRCLSQQYDLCAFGLREVRREWEMHDNDPMSNLIA